LLCTNGLTSVADDDLIAAALRSKSTPDDQCRALVDLAAGSDGADDATALVARYRIRG
jgi:protein phosphatase